MQIAVAGAALFADWISHKVLFTDFDLYVAGKMWWLTSIKKGQGIEMTFPS
jgi:hypothetical protein